MVIVSLRKNNPIPSHPRPIHIEQKSPSFLLADLWGDLTWEQTVDFSMSEATRKWCFTPRHVSSRKKNKTFDAKRKQRSLVVHDYDYTLICMYIHMIVLNKKLRNMFLEIGLQFLSYIHKKVGQKCSHLLCFVFQMFSPHFLEWVLDSLPASITSVPVPATTAASMFSTWAAVLTYTTPAPNTAVFTGPYRWDGDIDNMSAIQVSEDLEVWICFCELLDSLSYKIVMCFWWNQISYSYESQRVHPPKHHGVLPNNTQHQISYHISSIEIYKKQTSKQVTDSLFIPYFIPSKHMYIYIYQTRQQNHQDFFLHVFSCDYLAIDFCCFPWIPSRHISGTHAIESIPSHCIVRRPCLPHCHDSLPGSQWILNSPWEKGATSYISPPF